MLCILNTNDNIRLLRKSREKETLQFGTMIDKKLDQLEKKNGTHTSRKQSKVEAADSHPKIPKYVIF